MLRDKARFSIVLSLGLRHHLRRTLSIGPVFSRTAHLIIFKLLLFMTRSLIFGDLLLFHVCSSLLIDSFKVLKVIGVSKLSLSYRSLQFIRIFNCFSCSAYRSLFRQRMHLVADNTVSSDCRHRHEDRLLRFIYFGEFKSLVLLSLSLEVALISCCVYMD